MTASEKTTRFSDAPRTTAIATLESLGLPSQTTAVGRLQPFNLLD
jgi:hypothetical protein